MLKHTCVQFEPYNICMDAYGIVGKARWAYLSARHHIKPEPFRRWLYVVTSAEMSPSRRTNVAVCIFSYESSKIESPCTNIYLKHQNQTER